MKPITINVPDDMVMAALRALSFAIQEPREKGNYLTCISFKNPKGKLITRICDTEITVDWESN